MGTGNCLSHHSPLFHHSLPTTTLWGRLCWLWCGWRSPSKQASMAEWRLELPSGLTQMLQLLCHTSSVRMCCHIENVCLGLENTWSFLGVNPMEGRAWEEEGPLCSTECHTVHPPKGTGLYNLEISLYLQVPYGGRPLYFATLFPKKVKAT